MSIKASSSYRPDAWSCNPPCSTRPCTKDVSPGIAGPYGTLILMSDQLFCRAIMHEEHSVQEDHGQRTQWAWCSVGVLSLWSMEVSAIGH